MRLTYTLLCVVGFAAVMAGISAGANFLIYGVSDDFGLGFGAGFACGFAVMGYAAWRDHLTARERAG